MLVAADGAAAGYSVGMTNFELALTLVRLGAVTGAALASGTATTMAFDGALLDRPSAPGGELPLSDALLVSYYGVYVPPLATVLSPNGDGVDEKQSLSYRLVRPSTVTASLVGPGGMTQTVDAGARSPGTYRFTWDGAGAPEGHWRLAVTADDDLRRSSTAERTFTLDKTLGFLQAPATVAVRRAGSSLRGSFVLARPAQVQATIERPEGAVVRRLFARRLEAGTVPVSWNGRDARGVRVFSGRYVLRVTATNEVGTMSLAKPFRARRA